MARSKRILITLVVLELALAAGWFYLASLARSGAAPDPVEAQARIGEVFGGVMGGLAAFMGFAYVLASRKEREAEAAQQEHDRQDVFR